MLSLTCFNVRFTTNWLMLLLAAACIALFVNLGFWQIHRAEEKKTMLAAQEIQAKQEPISWDAEQDLPLQYQRLIVHGHYLPHVFFLDNQHVKHQFGFDVLTALALDDGSVVMVDRGWVPGDPSRRSFPSIQSPEGFIQLRGIAYFPSKNKWVLGPSFEELNTNTTILEGLDTKMMSQILQKRVYPYIIRLDRQDAHGFVREWAIVSMAPQRHLGYALQWFAMALAILILFLALNLKKQER